MKRERRVEEERRAVEENRRHPRSLHHALPILDGLTQRFARVAKPIRGEARLTEANVQEALREVRVALLEADVALPVV